MKQLKDLKVGDPVVVVHQKQTSQHIVSKVGRKCITIESRQYGNMLFDFDGKSTRCYTYPFLQTLEKHEHDVAVGKCWRLLTQMGIDVSRSPRARDLEFLKRLVACAEEEESMKEETNEDC